MILQDRHGLAHAQPLGFIQITGQTQRSGSQLNPRGSSSSADLQRMRRAHLALAAFTPGFSASLLSPELSEPSSPPVDAFIAGELCSLYRQLHSNFVRISTMARNGSPLLLGRRGKGRGG